MNYAVVFVSHTGNTELIAKRIQSVWCEHVCVCFGEATKAAETADLIFVGSWTDKGTFDEKMLKFLKSLHKKKIALFGTAGFGGDAQYFHEILARVTEQIPHDNEIVGTFMCQGKMPSGVRERYEMMLKKEPENKHYQAMVENYEHALSHPDEKDLQDGEVFASIILENEKNKQS